MTIQALTPAQSQARINGEAQRELDSLIEVAQRELAALIEVAQRALDSLRNGDEAWHGTADTGLNADKAQRSLAAARWMARFVRPA